MCLVAPCAAGAVWGSQRSLTPILGDAYLGMFMKQTPIGVKGA